MGMNTRLHECKRRSAMMTRTVRFKVRRGHLEPLEPVPLVEGIEVDVAVPIDAQQCTGAALRELVRQAPDIDPAIIDELDRAIEAAELPVEPGGVFDEERG
jgi:hypothetical protein